MATYVNDLRLKEIATGDESGTWGTSTNTNLELIAEAFSFGTEAITTNADTHTTTIADGSTDPGRSIYLKYTGALDSDCTVTIGPNTVSKLWFIENATTDSGSSGPYNIIIKQGSGATITVPNGQVKAIYSDGAGSGGAMVDAFTNLNVANNLSISGSTPTLTIGDAGAEDTKIVFDGNAQDFYVGLDDSADDLVIGKGSTVGTNPAIEIDENMDIKFAQSIGVGQAASSTTGDIVAQTMSLLGTTPTLTLGDGGEEDVKIQFNGVKDFYIANDDSADKLVIGEGSTVGTNSILTITDDALTIGDAAEVDTKIVFDGNAQDYYVGLDDSADSLVLGLGSTVGTTPAITINSSQQASFAQAVTADAGVAIDNITIDGTEIDLSSGDLTLDVAGDIILDAGGADILLKDDGTQFGELTNSSSDFVIKSSVSDKDIIFQGNDGGSGIEAMRIDMSAGGFVGIGTSSPDELLTISKNASSDSPSLIVRRSTDTSSSGDFVQGIKFANGTLSQRAEIQAVQGSQYADNIALNFVTMAGLGDRGTRMHIGGTGLVGIGTDSPSAALHVKSNGGIARLESTSATGNNYLSFYDSSALKGHVGYTGSSDDDFNIFQNESANIKLFTAGSERMRIDSSGQVGIGKTPSSANLDIASTGNGIQLSRSGFDTYAFEHSAGVGMAILNVTDSRKEMYFKGDGSIGIGTTSPVSLGGHDGVLTLFGSNATALVLKNDTSSSRLAQLGSDLAFFVDTHENERMRIKSGGAVLIGTTDLSSGTGIQLKNEEFHVNIANGSSLFRNVRSDSAGNALTLDRNTGDGDLLDLKKADSSQGTIGVIGNDIFINSTDEGRLHVGGTGRYSWSDTLFGPQNDNARDLGSSSVRWQDVYATNGTIQTSDRNEKQDIAELSEAEARVAVAVKGLLRKFKWKDAVAEKGDEARIHFGIIAQDLQDAFTAEGLDAGDYGMFISSTWTDDDGVEQTRLGVRYSELIAFIIAGI